MSDEMQEENTDGVFGYFGYFGHFFERISGRTRRRMGSNPEVHSPVVVF